MIFDLRFVNLELEAAKTGIVSTELTSSPVFRAISLHEMALDRPALDADSFERYLDAAAAGAENCWGLSALFDKREKMLTAMAWLEEEKDLISEKIQNWLAYFTSAPINPNLRCVLYVGTHDGGFKLGSDSETIYLNLPTIACREAFYETLAHESYHARARNPEAVQRIRKIEENDDYIGGVLYTTFEEGIADFIGYFGGTTTKYPVLPLRPTEEGTWELKQLLWDYKSGRLTGEALYKAFRKTDCCYTAGVYIASCVWGHLGLDGLDLWSVHRSLKAFYSAFRSTAQGADWPDLEL